MKLFRRSAPKQTEAAHKSNAYIVTDKNKVVPLSVFQKYTSQGDTTNVIPERVESYSTEWAKQRDLITHPYPPDSFLIYWEHNPTFNRTVTQLAVDVAGVGYDLILKEGAKENAAERDKIEALLEQPNPDMSFRRLCEALVIDEGAMGYMGMEVIRNLMGEISELHHVAAYTLFIHKSKKKFCQKLKDSEVWFKKFDEEGGISPKDGKDGGFSLKEAANELIWHTNYYPRNGYYGAPNILPAIGSVASLIGIRDYNLNFFDNYGVPAYFVTLTGEWDEKAADNIGKYLNTGVRSSDKAHSTMVLESSKEGSQANFQKLSVDVHEGSFKVLTQLMRDEVLSCYSMPPYRIGINIVGSLGGTNIKESTIIYNQAAVEPFQEDLENIVNRKILQQGLNSQSYIFKFKNMDTRDEDAEATRDQGWIETGVKTPNQVRRDRGLEPYPGGDSYYVKQNLIPVGEDEGAE